MPMRRTEAGSRPAGESLSFASPKERNQRKGDPAVCDPFAALRGNLGCSVAGCTAELAARLRRSARTTAVSQITRHARSDAHATPRPARPRRIQKGTRESDIHRGHRCARPRLLSAWRLRPRDGAERSKGPWGCLDVRLPPLLAAPAAGRLWGGMGVEAPMPRELTRRGCPSGAAQQQSEFHGAPRNRPAAGCPFATRRGRRLGVAFSLVTFFWRSKRKLLACRATPGSRTQHGNAVATAKTSFGRLNPNGWGENEL